MSSIASQLMPLDSLHRICWFDKKMINKQTITGLLSGYKKEHASMVSQFLCWCALDSIKVLYDKSKADNKSEKLHQKTYTPRCCSTMNDNEANVRIYL